MPPTVIFGDIRGMEPSDIKPILRKYGIKRLDTAAAYAGGDSEKRTGDAKMGDEFVVDTKILGGPLDGGWLSPEKVDESSRLSLERLQMEKVNVLYAHVPDLKTPLEEQARGFQEIYEKGRFREVGYLTFIYHYMFRCLGLLLILCIYSSLASRTSTQIWWNLGYGSQNRMVI